MARREWTEAEVQTLRERAAAGQSDTEIGRALDRSPNSVACARGRYAIPGGRLVRDGALPSGTQGAASGPEESIEVEESETLLRVASKSPRIKSAEELIADRGIDLDRWRIVKRREKQYEGMIKDAEDRPVVVPMYSVHLELAPNYEARSLLALRDSILSDLREHAPQYPAYRPVLFSSDASRYLLEIALFDKHFGKLAWKAETGEDYDIRIARERARWAVETLLERTRGFPTERILFPIGNDAGQIDNAQGTTTRGTQVDADSRWFKIFRELRLFYQWAIERCMEIAPVDVVVVPGNHDQQSVLALGEVLDAQYHRTERVQVMGGPRLRKYYEYGSNMILFTHGNEEKPATVPLLMATEEPEMWARTRFREAHTGHWHRKRETQFVGVDEYNGVRVRVLSSLSGTDSWHAAKGFTQNWKAAEAFVWDHDEGLVGQFSANLGPHPEPEPESDPASSLRAA